MATSKLVYMDANATGFMSSATMREMIAWCNRGNPSASYRSAKLSRQMMRGFEQFILDSIGATISAHTVVFTSGASESNAHIISAATSSFAYIRGLRPHVISSTVEHKSVILHLSELQTKGLIDVTFVPVGVTGQVDPMGVQSAIRPATCLITIMQANNETGAINDVGSIAEIAREANIILHIDAAQTYGRIPVPAVDAISMSCHKFGGPPGVGLLVLRRDILAERKLCPLIYGTQNNGLRGGTENIPGIAAAFHAAKLTMKDRESKAIRLLALKEYILAGLSKVLPMRTYRDYIKAAPGPRPSMEIIVLSPTESLYNTILISIVKRGRPQMCNSKFKHELECRGIIVSIGSACNTASPKASHVLFAMGADELIRRGTLRISLGGTNTTEDAKKFLAGFLDILKGNKWHAD